MQVLDHRYQLLDIAGEGGASVVHRALDLTTGELRAVKLLDVARDASASVARFQREARALLSLQHDHILPLYGLHLGERPYLVMELCSGETFRTVLERDGPLPAVDITAIGIALLDALHHAHNRGVIHRDIKPGNILIDPAGRPVLADFGIAVLARDRSRDTLEGLSLGTFAFMAPEQRMDARSVDPRADLYAMGATLYELATGLPATDLFMAGEGSGRWAGLPPALAAVLRRATRYTPGERYRTALEMREALKRSLDHRPYEQARQPA
jgi:serine/threonine-protein kinase